jgi:hypothetical protein
MRRIMSAPDAVRQIIHTSTIDLVKCVRRPRRIRIYTSAASELDFRVGRLGGVSFQLAVSGGNRVGKQDAYPTFLLWQSASAKTANPRLWRVMLSWGTRRLRATSAHCELCREGFPADRRIESKFRKLRTIARMRADFLSKLKIIG